jgi:glycosyltransferase involved in cell wall biosynthesis
VTVGIVFGTFNRIECVKACLRSIAWAEPTLDYEVVVIDGGSTDGTRECLREWNPTLHVIEQEGPLTGAVSAFNLGFGYCVDWGHEFVCHLNDDAELRTPFMITKAIELMRKSPRIGEVAFEHDLRGEWKFEHINGVPYANFGVIRREAGIAVAEKQGDPTGRAWWNPIYRTYGADTELGCWLWKLGWIVHEGKGLRVHDMQAQDALRVGNTQHNKNGDSDKFWARWKNERMVAESRRAARHRPERDKRIITRSMRGRPGNTPK